MRNISEKSTSLIFAKFYAAVQNNKCKQN